MTIEELHAIVQENPGRPEFVELARRLAEEPQNRAEAREICFRGLASQPDNARGRLLLARLFYLDGLGEFCVRELTELRKYVETPSLLRLIAALGVDNSLTVGVQEMKTLCSENETASEDAISREEELGSFDLDAEFIEALDELDISEDDS